MKTTLGFLFWMITLLGYGLSRDVTAQASEKPRQEPSQKYLPPVELKKAYLSDVVAAIGQKWHLNIVADVYLNDPAFEEIELKEVAPEEAEAALKALVGPHNREISTRNGVLIVRERHSPLRRLQEKTLLNQGALHWENEGVIKIKRDDAKPAERDGQSAGTADAAVTVLQYREKLIGRSAHQLPASYLSLEIANARFARTLQEFSRVSGWSVGSAPKLADYRISASLHHVTPGQALEALTALVNASQRLIIGQTEAQEALEAEQLDLRSLRQKLSDALAEKLAPLLSKEQKEQYAQGKETPLDVRSLPPNLQQLVRDYIEKSKPGLDIDFARFQDFHIVFLPAPSVVLGVDAYLSGGMALKF